MQMEALFELSQTSLTKNTSRADRSAAERKAASQSLERIELLIEKLDKLKRKIKKLDPNQESLNDISLKLSQSHAQLIPKKLKSTIEIEPLRVDGDVTSDCETDELARGKVVEYLRKLSDVLVKYERDRVLETAVVNYDRFKKLIKVLTELPPPEVLL